MMGTKRRKQRSARLNISVASQGIEEVMPLTTLPDNQDSIEFRIEFSSAAICKVWKHLANSNHMHVLERPHCCSVSIVESDQMRRTSTVTQIASGV